MQVPKFDGQHAIIPITGSLKKACSEFVILLINTSIMDTALENLSNTEWILPPVYMEIILKWSP